MYFPFFRARQFELLALRETMQKHISKDLVKPIIEPVVESTRDIFRFCEELAEVEAGFVLVVNPSVGYYSRESSDIAGLINECILRNPHIEFALRISDLTPMDSARSFVKDFVGFPISFIHENDRGNVKDIASVSDVPHFNHHIFVRENTGVYYRSFFQGFNNVILEDPFNRKNRNSDYVDEETFSNTVYEFKRDGFYGFGDYSIVGDFFSVGGGPARTCAIHITMEVERRALLIRHFLSNQKRPLRR
ncbi:sce7725 family protein [Vibrio coralliilyticus]|uniref:sce7725 family protein n=1 Tax=Vibrio coralliilyticus TaxID=190893 RepID=UPI0002E7EF8E|nr:sce7725 family protein [Vibrio coralliilyticus]